MRRRATLKMGGKGGCQNVGDDKRPNWVVGWSAADGSQLFALTVQALPNGKTEERFVLKPAGERSFTLTSVAAATITRKGKGVRFTLLRYRERRPYAQGNRDLRGADHLTVRARRRRLARAGAGAGGALRGGVAQAAGMPLAARIRGHVRAEQPRILAELVEFLRVPNLASDSAGIRANAALLIRMLERRGVDRAAARVADRRAAGGLRRAAGPRRHPDDRALRALRRAAGAARRLGHAAVDTDAPRRPGAALGFRRSSCRRPMTRSAREARLYARSAGDDKSPIVAMLAALDALRARGHLTLGQREVLLRR